MPLPLQFPSPAGRLATTEWLASDAVLKSAEGWTDGVLDRCREALGIGAQGRGLGRRVGSGSGSPEKTTPASSCTGGRRPSRASAHPAFLSSPGWWPSGMAKVLRHRWYRIRFHRPPYHPWLDCTQHVPGVGERPTRRTQASYRVGSHRLAAVIVCVPRCSRL